MKRAPIHWSSSRRLLIFLAAFAFSGEACPSTESTLTPLESGTHSNVPVRSFQAVFDQDAFRNLHRHIHSHRLPPPSAPTVDFDRFVVVAAFMGQRSTLGYRIRFGDAVAVEDGTAILSVTESQPPPNTVQGQVITTPYAIAALAHGSYEKIAFVDPYGTVLESVTLLKDERPQTAPQRRRIERKIAGCERR